MSFADKKIREKEERRDDILNAAEKLFFSRNYDSVSMDDIARAVDVNKALLYYYFKDKESLYFALVLRGLEILSGMLDERSGNDKTCMKKLRNGGRVYAEFATKYPEYLQAYSYLLSGRFDLSNPSKNRDLSRIMEIRKKTFDLTRALVEGGVRDGSIRPDVNPVEVSVLFSMVFDSFSRMTPQQVQVLENEGIGRHEFLADARDLLDYIIMNDKTGKN